MSRMDAHVKAGQVYLQPRKIGKVSKHCVTPRLGGGLDSHEKLGGSEVTAYLSLSVSVSVRLSLPGVCEG